MGSDCRHPSNIGKDALTVGEVKESCKRKRAIKKTNNQKPKESINSEES